MKTIVRIQIENAHYGDYGAGISAGQNCKKGADFADRHNLRYGNGVVFAVQDKAHELLALLAEEGFTARLDGFKWDITEPSDYFPGALVQGGRIRILEDYNPTSMKCEEVVPRYGYKRCRKNLRITPSDYNHETLGIYGI